MTASGGVSAALREWLAVPGEIEKAIEGLTDAGLDRRGGKDGWSIRETVHHLVEAHLVASNMLIAALAGSRSAYDWSWVNPDAAWMKRVGYTTAPVAPALAVLRSLCDHFAGLLAASPDASGREVRILDAPGAEPYARTAEQLVAEQVEHAKGHLEVIREIRGGR